jgi:hypothetical protein
MKRSASPSIYLIATVLGLTIWAGPAYAGSSVTEGASSDFMNRWDAWRTGQGTPGFTPAGAQEVKDRLAEGSARAAEVRKAERDALRREVQARFEYGRGVIESLRELIEAYRALSERDRPYDPSVRPDGAPDLPVSCATEQCGECYRAAQDELNRVMFRFEKLRTLFTRTKTYVDKAISFGTSASSIHAVQGLAWQKAKKEIEASMERMNTAYDAKKPELMAALRSALDAIADCEAEHYNNPDWYNRFGFIYYQFIDQKYKR